MWRPRALGIVIAERNCITGLAEAVNELEKPGTKPVARTVARRLRALIESGGQDLYS